MIKAIIFDLDGTLVQTEVLKAKSYAKAAVELNPSLKEEDVVQGFKEFVGLSRKEVAKGLLNKFDLGDAASKRMKEFEVAKPWQAFIDIRLDSYFKMISDPTILKEHLCPYNLALLKWARKEGYPTGLGTMSHRKEAYRVLDVLGIRSDFEVISTIQDVEHGKPDPEIYNLLAEELRISHNEGLAIEDSSSGVRAALAANIRCIAVPSDFTRDGVHKLPKVHNLRVVDNQQNLLEIAKTFISELNSHKEIAN
ncbi:MAG: HAD family phosphatase [Thermodesulfobacteriota bacterium]